METETIQLLDHHGNPFPQAAKAIPWTLAKDSPLRDRQAANQLSQIFGGDGKRGSSKINHGTLRTLSIAYPVARACINKRKDQILSVEWEIAPKPKKTVSDATLQKAQEYFSTAGGIGGPGVRLRHFISVMVEDLLVLDAIALYKQKTKGGDDYALVYFDAGTIQLLADENGFRPQPPAPAFQQVIDGKVRGKWTTEEILYDMMYPRTCTLYGLPPLECLITTIEAAIRSELWNLEWFTSGNIPEGYMGLPKEWTPQQIADFMIFWNAQLQGNMAERQKIKFGPEGTFKEFIGRGDMQFEKLQSWLADITCAIFGINPTTIGLSGRTFKYAQEGQIDASRMWGLQPLLEFFKEIFDDILAEQIGEPNLEWQWQELEEEQALDKANTDKVYLDAGVITRDDVRREQGLDPLKDGLMDVPFVMSSGGPVPLLKTPEILAEEAEQAKLTAEAQAAAQAQQKPQDATEEGNGAKVGEGEKNSAQLASVAQKTDRWESMATDIKLFRRKCLKALDKGKPIPTFEPTALPAAFMADLRKALAQVEDSPQTIRLVLSGAVEQVQELASKQIQAAA